MLRGTDEGRATVSWSLQLHASARLAIGAGSIDLERKTAALLAALAIEGPTSRSRLAGLLWPEAPEQRARANLRQTLSRLRKLAQGDLVEQGDPLRLSSSVQVELSHELLRCHDYDECSDFSIWLDNARERLARVRFVSLEAESEQRERRGDIAAALDVAEEALAVDPFSERTVRRIMRLHAALGDRAAALRVFSDCERMLDRELGVRPAQETAELAHVIRAGDLPSPETRFRHLHAATLHPARVVGREREWARLEAAWDAGKLIFLSGPAGVGKSRLALDFARSRGVAMLIESRPGDAGVPFASQARAVRQVFSTWPDLALPPWVRHELSRMLPELAPSGVAPPPLEGSDDKLHFLEAQVELMRRAAEFQQAEGDGIALVVDDLQFCDPWSAEVGHYTFSTHPIGGNGIGFRPIITFRTGRLPPPLQRSVLAFVDAGIAEWVDLAPLDRASVDVLLADMGLHLTDGLEVTGGLPALVLELAKSTLGQGGAQPSAKSDGADRILRSRIRHLSGTATQLAQVAAVTTDRLDAELAAAVLEVRPLELAEAWTELESAQILRDGVIVHDLVREALLGQLPQALVEHLHRAVASHLETRGGNPTAIAVHWQAGGEPERAARHLLSLDPPA